MEAMRKILEAINMEVGGIMADWSDPRSECREILRLTAQALTLSSPHPEAQEEDIAESEAISHELGAGRFVHGISKPIEISQDDEPIVWQLDFAATLPWGEEIKGVESEGSWFLIDQRGKVWEYGPAKAPAPLGNEYTRAIPLLKVGDNYMTWAEIISRLAAQKDEGHSCRDCQSYDCYEGESCEHPERGQCIDHSLFEPRDPAAPEPRPAEEPVPAPSEEDGPLKSVIHALETADDLGSSVVLDPEEISALRSQLAQATNNAQFWMGENSKTTRYYEAQLARKDEGMRKALEEAAQSLEALAGLAGKDETMLEYDQVRGYALNRAMAARAALREPDGRKGE